MDAEQTPSDSPVRKRKFLNPRQRRFIKAFPVSKSGKEAAIKAGFPVGGAEVAASEMLADPRIHSEIEKAMERAGLSLDDLIKPIKDSLGAMKDDDTHVDHATRLKGSEQGLKLAGHLSQKVEITGDTFNLSQYLTIIREEAKKRGLPDE